MPIIKFDLEKVKALVDDARAATAHSPTLDMLFNADYHKDSTIRDKDGHTEIEVEKLGGHFWASYKNIDTSLIEPCLQLVGDQGVYLMNNSKNDSPPTETGLLVYAQGINPDVDEDWYENKVSSFGGDDGAVTVPLAWFDIAYERKGERFLSIKMTPEDIELV